MILDELVAVLGFKYTGGGDADRFKRELDSIDGAAHGAATALSKVELAISGALAGLAIGNKIGDFIADITQAGRTAENFKTQLMTTFSGDEGKANGALDWIEQFASVSPEGINEITAAFVKLRAYGLDPTTGVMQSIGDAAAGMGKSTDQGVEAMADAVTGEFERLKEFAGIKAKQSGDAVTFAWSEAGKDQSLTVKKSSAEIQKALMGIMDRRFSGAMESKAQTFDGILGKIGDRWQRFLRQIADGGYFDVVKGKLSEFADLFEDMDSNGTLPSLARGISRVLVGAVNTASHLATQAYRIARGFYVAADSIAELTSRVTGLSKTMSGAGIGLGLIASSAMGRGALMALARRVPMVAAALALDDIMSGLNGDDSVVGSMPGGQAALDRIVQKMGEVRAAANGMASSINDALGLKGLNGEDALGTLMRSVQDFISGRVVKAFDDFATRLGYLADALNAIASAIKDPQAAFSAFADAAIAQIDRIVAAVDEKLGGALMRFGFIGAPAVAQANTTPIKATGQTTRAATPRIAFTPMGELEQDGRVNAEGIGAQYKIDPDRLANGANAVAKFMLDVTNFTDPANQAKAMMKDLERTFTAKVDVNTDAAMAKVQALKAELSTLNGMSSGAGVGRAAVQDRAAVVASPGG